MQPITAPLSTQATPPPARDADLAAAARALEASFLSLMLKEAGVGAPRSAFGGGPGEQQFASFLTDAYAARIVEGGGIGLAEHLFRALEAADADR